ncbi:MAG: S8 family serine peptidase, partial [Candidatus Kapaibacterium sp.]
MKRLLTILIVFCFSLNLAAQESYEYPFLDNNAMGTLDLIKSNENYDGRGILIFILDNGVDPDIPGLQQTSHGERKVIDMKDFSNQLNIQLNKAEKTEINGRNVLKTEATTISGYENLELQPVEQDEYYVGVLYEEEYKNSAVDDINQNGRTNDEFAALAFKVSNAYDILKDAPGKVKANPGEDLWVYYIDEDMDGNIDDEKPKFDYKYRFDVFDFHVGDEKTRPMFTFSAWVDPVKMILNVHTTDGSHGSHCAGIAAGNDIYGVAGNDGIAPGAYVASLKIGSNILSGGSTTLESMKAAYEYGAKFMQEAGFEHAVFSMSYGIGSETPGRSEIEIFLNDFVKKNPGCIVVTSNGNSGPGINSTGNPAGAEGLISVGAMVTPKTL